MTKKYPDPKKLDYSRPMLWMASASANQRDERNRIVYPWGNPEWLVIALFEFWDKPCWYRRGMTPRQQVAAMKAYDKREGRTTIFLGYLA